jgi:hypothetical protein
MSGLRPVLGFGDDMAAVLDRFGTLQLDALNAHFARHRFLLGDRPCYGDYGLIGPLYAHIGRDPLSKRDLIEPRPHLAAWIARMFQPDSSRGGEFLAGDAIPVTLMPALRSMFDEMVPFLQGCADALRALPLPGPSEKAPRFFGTVSYPMSGGTHVRQAASYPLWQAQRMLHAYRAMSRVEQSEVQSWLAQVGGRALLDLDLPRMERTGLAARRLA